MIRRLWSSGQVAPNVKQKYRVTKVVADLGWVDLDLISSPGMWAATVATYCPNQMVQHPKSKSTQPRSATTIVTLYMKAPKINSILHIVLPPAVQRLQVKGQ